MKEKLARVLALSMCFILVFTSIDLTVFADFNQKEQITKVVNSFTALPEDVASQEVKSGETADAVSLPGTIEAEVTVTVHADSSESAAPAEKTQEQTVTPEAPATPETPAVPETTDTPEAPDTQPAADPAVETPKDDPAPEEVQQNQPETEENQEDNNTTTPSESQTPETTPDPNAQPSDTGMADELLDLLLPSIHACAAENATPAEDAAAQTPEVTQTEDAAAQTPAATLAEDGAADTATQTQDQVTTEKEDLQVSWSIDPAQSSGSEFSSETPGKTYVYVPALPEGYTLADGVTGRRSQLPSRRRRRP